MKAYRVECEWDIGMDDLFTSREDAEKAIDSNPIVGEIIRDMRFQGVEEIFAAGLLHIKEVNVR